MNRPFYLGASKGLLRNTYSFPGKILITEARYCNTKHTRLNQIRPLGTMPKKSQKKLKIKILTFRMRQDDYDKLALLASHLDRTITGAIRKAIIDFMKNHDDTDQTA